MCVCVYGGGGGGGGGVCVRACVRGAVIRLSSELLCVKLDNTTGLS